MKEAISNAMIFNLIIVFVVILIMLFIGSLSYSKAFKVKNRIVEEIEKDEDYTEKTVEDINNWISSEGVGYRLKSTTVSHNCPDQDDGVLVSDGTGSNPYDYCVYEYNTCSKKSDTYKCGRYYRVIAYMYFDFPIIGDLIRIPVRGETVTFNAVDTSSDLGHVVPNS